MIPLIEILVHVDALRRLLALLRGRSFEVAPTLASRISAPVAGRVRLELHRAEAQVALDLVVELLDRRAELEDDDVVAVREVHQALRGALGRAPEAEAEEVET